MSTKRGSTKPKPIYIEWVDSEGVDGWDKLPEDHEDKKLIVTTVGYLVKTTTNNLIIAHSIDAENNNYLGILTIPKEAITKKILIKL